MIKVESPFLKPTMDARVEDWYGAERLLRYRVCTRNFITNFFGMTEPLQVKPSDKKYTIMVARLCEPTQWETYPINGFEISPNNISVTSLTVYRFSRLGLW